jgi:putative hydrolase of the HAD superfamily
VGPVDVATYAGTALALLGLGFGAARAFERLVSRPRAIGPQLADPPQVLSRINFEFAHPDLRRLDVVGYSVHSIYDRIQGLVDHALRLGVPVRFLMLSSEAVGLEEKAFLEHGATDLDRPAFQARSRASIKRTAFRIDEGANTARYQANLGSVSCRVRVYDALPVYRGVLTNLGSVTSSYLDDLSLPSRDFLMHGPDSDPVADLEGRRADQWFQYLWEFRSRPVGTSAVLFDLYDTLAHIDPQARAQHRSQVSRRIGVPIEEFVKAWEDTKESSNAGGFPTTAHRFMDVLQRLGHEGRAPQDLAMELAVAEHEFLRDSVRVSQKMTNLLVELRQRGYQLGLVTNCSPSVMSWFGQQSLRGLVDSATFSFEVGSSKPHAQVYDAALSALDLEPDSCVYVGDGEDRELDGATTAGMRTVRAAWYSDKASFRGDSVAHSAQDLARIIDPEARWRL